MKRIKLIISFILLVSLFLGIVSCTPAEESNAESTGDVSVDVSEEVSEEPGTDVSFIDADKEPFDESIGEISDDQLVLKLQNGKMKILDRYIDGKTLCIVQIEVDREERDAEFIGMFGYEPSEALKNNSVDSEQIYKDMASFLEDIRHKKIVDFYDRFSIEKDQFSFKKAYILHSTSEIFSQWYREIQHENSIKSEYYKIRIVVMLTEDEIEMINEAYNKTYDTSYLARPLWKFLTIGRGSNYYYYYSRSQGTLD